jgi:formylglycine-generating enzyme required for sulfatase activity
MSRYHIKRPYRFAVGRYLVTFDEYDHFCSATGTPMARDDGWGRGRQPVINVSWSDAQKYCNWLSRVTKKQYRLLTEAEWEYACRATTITKYALGNRMTSRDANFGQKSGKTSAVGTYAPNGWGLFDMHGNVWEWTQDVWHPDYEGAPSDGSAWVAGGEAGSRVMRGGSWSVHAKNLRSDRREKMKEGVRASRIGFRVCRSLTEEDSS